MLYLLQRLKPNERRGSKPRCHLLTHGSIDAVSERLTNLIAPWGKVSTDDRWMPRGFVHTEEAQFGRVDTILDHSVGETLVKWWLALPKVGRVPHWDISSTCTIEGKQGLLLVEAKAHDTELIKEEVGKRKEKLESDGSMQNRKQIELRMMQVNASFKHDSGLDWHLSTEHHYQMSNRFAWAWKLTALGFPVILVYLGFLNAGEMIDKGIPFGDHVAWETLVKTHSQSLFPEKVWGARWGVNSQPFIPLIKSYEQQLKV